MERSQIWPQISADLPNRYVETLSCRLTDKDCREKVTAAAWCVVLNQTGQSPYPRFFKGNKNLLILFHSCRVKECEVEYMYGKLKRMPFVTVG